MLSQASSSLWNNSFVTGVLLYIKSNSESGENIKKEIFDIEDEDDNELPNLQARQHLVDDNDVTMLFYNESNKCWLIKLSMKIIHMRPSLFADFIR